GFYDSAEVADLLSLLKLFDNPLQDLPALAVLRSPLVGMSLDELATMRLTQSDGHIWTALQRYHDASGDSGRPKADRFLKNFAAWRRLARQVSLSRCLEAVLDGTHYAEWLLTQPRGEQRHANVRRLLALAQQFDRFQRQGLFRFLRFVEAQQAAETGPEVAAVSGGNSVFLMSVHQSKGLEFPVVAVVDLGKPFNLADLNAEVILDEEYGLCPQIKPPHSGQRYPSLPWWLARRRQKQKSLGEELRLLYVAMTRARDTLILSGTAPAKKFAGAWREGNELNGAAVLAAGSYLDWVMGWAAAAGVYPDPPAGGNGLWRWTIYEDLDERLALSAAQASLVTQKEAPGADPNDADWQKLRQRLAWEYPHIAATHLAAKTTVTALRRQFADENEAQVLFGSAVERPKFKVRGRSGGKRTGLSATEIGTAHHTFLQLVSLERVGGVEELRQEGQRLEAAGSLSGEEVASLDFEALTAFWQSELGRRIRGQAKNVRRELEFTARISPRELEEGAGSSVEDEFIVMQGAADLAVVSPGDIWLVDFKTDQITAAELAGRLKEYEVQLRLYARALSGVYGRPVTEAWLHFLALGQSVGVELKIQNAESGTQ
ncbi:MAG TPA: 3'-5' exonuclease, partial [Verrucomicrobiae bacterium]|nr:3'-5' exonuclease [Verrucomicrobiae bacterium]